VHKARTRVAIFGRDASRGYDDFFPLNQEIGRLGFVNESAKSAFREMNRATTLVGGHERSPSGGEATPKSSEEDFARRPLHSELLVALKEPRKSSSLEDSLRLAARILAVVALLASGVLLLRDAAPKLAAFVKFVIAMAPRAWALLGHAPLSAMPLLLVGASYIALQGLLRPAPIELVKRLLLGSAFLLWGIVQLMPPSVLATDLGDLVIALYVLDLGIIVDAELRGLG
jgi:hypothetical protein